MTNHVQIQGITPRIQYIANGTLKTYTFPFAIFKSSDIKVYLNDVLQESDSYIVTSESNTTGGSITFNTAPPKDVYITLFRDLKIERTTDFQEGGALRANTLNDEFDYQIACTQQIADNLNRSMVLPPYAIDSDVNLTLPTPKAGKALIWNSTGTNLENSTVSINELESTLNSYKNQAQSAAATATDKASVATSKAQAATEQATIATTKATEAISTLNQLNSTRTNCLTEIPQNIKVELNNGTVTLKAGSKVYVPNGVGVFNELTTSSDLTLGPVGTYTGYSFLFVKNDGTALAQGIESEALSGTTTPTGNSMWYDTTNNLIKHYLSGSDTGNRVSLPIARIHRTSGSWDTFEAFNGFGYMGSTAFALPGIKGLIPNGRNENGTLKNIAFAFGAVKTITETKTNNYTFITNGTAIGNSTIREYDPVSNYVINTQTGAKVSECILGDYIRTSGVISNFSIKPTFHALDYEDGVKYTDKELIVSWGMPNYSATISNVGNNYTAPKDGYFLFALPNGVSPANSSRTISINSINYTNVYNGYGAAGGFPILLAKGDRINIASGATLDQSYFVPMKGV